MKGWLEQLPRESGHSKIQHPHSLGNRFSLPQLKQPLETASSVKAVDMSRPSAHRYESDRSLNQRSGTLE